MSTLDLAEIRAALEAASPGPWAAECIGEPGSDFVIIEYEHHREVARSSGADAALIAHAPTWLRELVEEVEDFLNVAAMLRSGRAEQMERADAAEARVRALEADDSPWSDGHDKGAADERAAVVAFLRDDAEHGGESCSCVLAKADAIESGAHLKERKP